MPPQLHGMLETSLYVHDVERAVAFYKKVLGLREIPDTNFANGRGAALQVGGGPSVLLLFRAEVTQVEGPLPAHGTSGAGHAAFRVDSADLSAWREHLWQHGVTIEREFTFGNNPPSIYFRDPDGNSLEFAVASIWKLEFESPQ
jgi:catechol 2,3-dioxygenase-like lactoylglutathione lyase family enzyme